ncbi:MAG: fructosamine kinase family protein, partial [Phycisphaeraceae bacterium]|nr:fructosamine kinase family protein [Phycisphaeraceae bacterium]
VPEVLAVTDTHLVLELIETGSGSDVMADLGERLAKLHRHQAEHYGFEIDNFLGPSPQRNTPTQPASETSWPQFFYDYRLVPQIQMAEAGGRASAELSRLVAKLENRIEEILAGPAEASLLHGDLWSGNTMVDATGAPVLIDPAVYYGHREADLAMTSLFGGFGRSFYDAYDATWPREPGWEQREPLYQAYHVINHLNVFGGGYLSQAEGLLRRYASR